METKWEYRTETVKAEEMPEVTDDLGNPIITQRTMNMLLLSDLGAMCWELVAVVPVTAVRKNFQAVVALHYIFKRPVP